MHAFKIAPKSSLISLWLAGSISTCAGTRDLRAQATPRNPGPPIPAPHITQEPPTNQPVIAGTDVRFYRAATADGLSQVRATKILQDDQGFMWFGTAFGLNRYDGYKFKVFMHDPRQPNSIGDNLIMALFKDRSGMLWVASNRFLDRLDPTTEKFTHYQVEADHPAGIVVHISQDRAGMLWLASGT